MWLIERESWGLLESSITSELENNFLEPVLSCLRSRPRVAFQTQAGGQ